MWSQRLSNVVNFELAVASRKKCEASSLCTPELVAFRGIDLQTVKEMMQCLELKNDQIRLNFFKARYSAFLKQDERPVTDDTVYGYNTD